jgi:hypothetical protein
VAGDSRFIWFMGIKLIKCVVICMFLLVNAKIFTHAFTCALFYFYIYLIIFIYFVLIISCLLLIILFMHASLHVITEGAFLLADWSLVYLRKYWKRYHDHWHIIWLSTFSIV